jgi:hypothetical protein
LFLSSSLTLNCYGTIVTTKGNGNLMSKVGLKSSATTLESSTAAPKGRTAAPKGRTAAPRGRTAAPAVILLDWRGVDLRSNPLHPPNIQFDARSAAAL